MGYSGVSVFPGCACSGNCRADSAEAEAKSMAIRANALSKNKALVEYEAVQKWNGILPQYMMGESIPFINLNNRR